MALAILFSFSSCRERPLREPRAIESLKVERMMPAPISPGENSLPCAAWSLTQSKPGANAKKGLGMSSLIATILVLVLLVYLACLGFGTSRWPWPWHSSCIWPGLGFCRSHGRFNIWLQQIQVRSRKRRRPTRRADGYMVSPQRTDESRIHFEELGQKGVSASLSETVLCAKDWAGKDVFLWEGRRWYLPHNEAVQIPLCSEKRLECVADTAKCFCGAMQESQYRLRMGGVGERRSVTRNDS